MRRLCPAGNDRISTPPSGAETRGKPTKSQRETPVRRSLNDCPVRVFSCPRDASSDRGPFYACVSQRVEEIGEKILSGIDHDSQVPECVAKEKKSGSFHPAFGIMNAGCGD